MENTFGIIYKATNTLNGKVYIGQTTQHLYMRKQKHKYRAKFGDKRTAFQLALLEEGTENFTWKIIGKAENKEELDKKEKHWIAHYKSIDPAYGYNSADGGIKPVYNEETRRRNSETHKGKHPSEEARRKMSEARKGRKHSSEHRKKNSEAKKGNRNPGAIITETIARQIKTDLQAGMRNCDIVRKNNVSKAIVENIKYGRTWSWVASA